MCVLKLYVPSVYCHVQVCIVAFCKWDHLICSTAEACVSFVLISGMCCLAYLNAWRVL